jgi:hypothetical protein
MESERLPAEQQRVFNILRWKNQEELKKVQRYYDVGTNKFWMLYRDEYLISMEHGMAQASMHIPDVDLETICQRILDGRIKG